MDRAGVAAVFFVVLLAGCAPRTLVVPHQFDGTPVLEDLRREVRRSRLFVRVTTTQGSSGMVFPASFFQEGEFQEGELREGESPGRVYLVPDRDRSGAILDALSWLESEGVDQVLIAVRPGDEIHAANLDRVHDHPEVQVLEFEALSPDGDAAARRIVEMIEGDTATAGVILLLGHFSPSVARALSRHQDNGAGVGPIVGEVLLSTSGGRLRRTGIPLAGAIALDLSSAVQTAKSRKEASNTIYVQSVFHRY